MLALQKKSRLKQLVSTPGKKKELQLIYTSSLKITIWSLYFLLYNQEHLKWSRSKLKLAIYLNLLFF
jgi:hypothetical protein